MMRFDRFTAGSQDAAARAYEILQRYGHNQIDTEHLLLALLEQPDGTVPQLLEKLNVDQETLKHKLDEILKAFPKASIYGGGTGQVFMTPRVKRVIDLAQEEASNLKAEYIGTEHMFLAIMSETRGPIVRIIQETGITKEQVKALVKTAEKEPPVAHPAPNVNANVNLIVRFNDAFNRHNVDDIMALMTDDCIFENTNPPPDGRRYEGQTAVRACWEELFTGSPHAHFDFEEIFLAEDRAVVRWRYQWGDSPSNQGHIRGVDIFRIRDGKVAEKLSYVKG